MAALAHQKTVHLVQCAQYCGDAGVEQVRLFQQELNAALAREDWNQVRRLDTSCTFLIDKVIAANKGDEKALLAALSELKGVYAGLIVQCQREVAAMAH